MTSRRWAIPALLVFVYRPLIQSFYLSTLQWNLGSPVARSIGLGNYVELFTSRNFTQVVTTTVVFTVATVGGAMLLGLGLAVLLNQKLRGRGFAQVRLSSSRWPGHGVSCGRPGPTRAPRPLR